MGQAVTRNAKVKTLYLQGLEGNIAEVEASIFPGLPSFEVVGLGDSSIREAKERVRASIRSCGFTFPNQRLLVNISPAYLHKSGSSFDLAIAMAILLASGQVTTQAMNIVIYGELSLVGQVRPVPGSISRLLCLETIDDTVLCIVPSKDMDEAGLLGCDVYGVDTLQEAISIISGDKGEAEIRHVVSDEPGQLLDPLPDPQTDISALRGQPDAERAIVLAASGFHNMLLVGSPGTGKSLSAKILQGILPPLSREEKIELLRVESALSVLSKEDIASGARPFRYVHHTCTPTAMVGGGRNASPGEISRALHGILFLDELPEFTPHVLDLLRVPIESGEMVISRNNCTNVFPARFMLVAAMNPCRCGKCMESPSECTCTPSMIASYQGKVSGALLDRMDISCTLNHISEESLLETMKGDFELQSMSWRRRIEEIWERQYERCDEAGIARCRNGEMREKNLGEIFRLGQKQMEYAAMAAHQLQLSVRGLQRVVRLARTVADLDEKKDVECEHIVEAISFRLPQWGSNRGG
ncbi:MAG: YifB family Mg chelatase-like AAA ATPase [Clostridiales bacterium]|nr:YifB family Mg chelatase-like AAA ATPase [Clostridiales bacterium]